jgi:tetratricopeptide (TPR) repeat protein
MKTCMQIFLLVLLVFIASVEAQNKSEPFKTQAELLMREGRYAEAIDQLDKYVTANPRVAKGYHLRALCFEKTMQYQYSVLDLRRAVRLDASNKEIRNDLSRVIGKWHELLYQKIDGHKRDLAIDPNKAFTYLEIGKSYRWLEEWSDAESWYDQYLKRDDNASPDEIIRYTEILAKTGSIIKGERILKKFVERYPTDWRLWSRYGYFVMWLGKNNLALDAFTKSLGFKPFFQEALDGLDLAKREGYLTQFPGRAFERVEYPIDRYYRLLEKNQEDDSLRYSLTRELISANRYEEAYQQLQALSPKHAEEEYYKSLLKKVTDYRDSTFNNAVESNTAILKEDPTNKGAVLKLAEAYGNLYYYDNALEVLSEYLQDIPENQDLDVRFLYAKYLAWNYEWEKSQSVLNKLLEIEPNNLDYILLRGQIGSWTVQDLDQAEKDLLKVYDGRPNSLPTVLGLVTVYSWKNNYPEAKKYLDIAHGLAPRSSEVESAESNYQLHLSAYEEVKVFEIKGEVGKLAQEGKCEEALTKYEEYRSKRTALTRDELIEFADVASCAKQYNKAIEAYNSILSESFDYRVALSRAKNYYYNQDTAKAVEELESLSKLNPDDDEAKLFLADTYVFTQNPNKAEEIYKSLLTKTEDENSKENLYNKMLFAGDAYVVKKEFDKANNLYGLLEQKSANGNFKRELILRKIYLSNALIQDNKLDEAHELMEKINYSDSDTSLTRELNQSRFALGDSYVNQEKYGTAEDMYNKVIETTVDTSEVSIAKQRIEWLPPSGFQRGISSVGTFFSYFLPTNMGASPFAAYYRDNQKFQIYNYGVRADAGFIGFLSLGALWSKSTIDNSVVTNDFIQFKGIGTIFISRNFSMSGSYGVLRPRGEPQRNIGDVILKFEKPDEALIQLSYENNDARMFLYSPNMIYLRLNENMYRFLGYYDHKSVARISGSYNYFKMSDGNEGNDLQIRLGRKFQTLGMFGYEYYFSDYAFISPYYYSPKNFQSHSLWTEWKWLLVQNLKLKTGGKIGYVPDVDFVISEIFAEATYNPIISLNITGRIGYGNSFRYDSSYKFFSASIFIYWGVF